MVYLKSEKKIHVGITVEGNANSKIVLLCILLGISPAPDCGLPTFRNPPSVPSSRAGCKVHPSLEDGTDRVFRNVDTSYFISSV